MVQTPSPIEKKTISITWPSTEESSYWSARSRYFGERGLTAPVSGILSDTSRDARYTKRRLPTNAV